VLQLLWKGKRTRRDKAILKNNNKVEELLYLILRHKIATVIKTVWYW
jgi:hypothetical protein